MPRAGKLVTGGVWRPGQRIVCRRPAKESKGLSQKLDREEQRGVSQLGVEAHGQRDHGIQGHSPSGPSGE